MAATATATKRGRTARSAVTPMTKDLDRLTRLRSDKHWVTSCYLKLEPRDRSRGKYLIKVKNRARRLLDGLPRLGLDRAEQERVQRDVERIQQHLRNPGHLPAAQGVAIFASEGLGLFEEYPLPVVYRSRMGVDRSPLVRELAAVDEEFGRLLGVVLDRTSARFFEITAFGAVELPGLRSDNTRSNRFHGDQDGPSGWGEHTFNNRIREEKQRHYDRVARELFTLDRRHPAHGIIVGGMGTDAGAVEPFLHSYLAERLLGTFRMNPKTATVATVHEAALAVRADAERRAERMLVAEVEEALGTRWAVNGIRPTLRALSNGQVRSLLIHADAEMPGFRCSETGELVLAARDCRASGEPVPVLDVVDEAIEEALRQGVGIDVVYEEEARERINGLAALLRFR